MVDTSLKSDTDHRPDSYPSRSTYDQDILGELIDMDETCLMGERPMEVKAATQEDGGLKPPALPPRSSLRASKLVDDFKLAQAEPEPSLKTPHDIYLSSEEDASSSAGDFSDDDYESGSEASQQAQARRGSQEDTARVVSVIYSGKPCIVHLGGSRRSSSPDSTSDRSQSSCHEEALNMLEAKSHAVRQSSLLSLESRPSFLSIDPFADTECPESPKKDDDASPRTPRTPSMMFKMQKTLGLVRKRSRPMLHNLAAASRESFISFSPSSSTNLAAGFAPEEPKVLQRASTASVASPSSPARYSEFMKSARKKSFTAPQPQPTPMSPHGGPVASKKPLLGSFNLARRKSIKS